ncbi:MAG: hypothetical protein HY908_15810, partial [Myxococcales bacterium]|nr:hypothetical protein [Myxococcales bacterium]
MTSSAGVLPAADATDSDDVRWALETAHAMWMRGDQAEALKWLRRAAETASEEGADMRSLMLARAAADLRIELDAGASAPPPAAEPGAAPQPGAAASSLFSDEPPPSAPPPPGAASAPPPADAAAQAAARAASQFAAAASAAVTPRSEAVTPPRPASAV